MRPELQQTLDLIGDIIEDSSAKELFKTPTGFTFNASLGKTVLDIKPIEVKPENKSPFSDVIFINTPLSDEAEQLDLEKVNGINSLTVMSAIMLDEEKDTAGIINRISIPKDSENAWGLLGPLTAFTAILQSDSIINLLQAQKKPGLLADIKKEIYDDSESSWSASDFSHAAEYLKRRFDASASEHNLKAVFPLGDAACFGPDNKATLDVCDDAAHPIYGNGLSYKITIPYASDNLPSVANRLNFTETRAFDGPPFLGAWSAQKDTGSLVFKGHLPIMLFYPGFITNLAVWMSNRVDQAKTWLA